MPLYIINRRTSIGFLPPLAAEDLADLNAVRRECAVSAKQVAADVLRNGGAIEDALAGSFEVTDESGITLLTMSFADAVQIETGSV